MRLLFIMLFYMGVYAQEIKNDTIIENISFDSLKTSIFQDSLKKDTLMISNQMFKKNVLATYYAKKFNGRRTASGEVFSNEKLTAAHKKLPFGTKLLVTNKKNGKSVVVIVNDRGPFGRGKEIDLSRKAFLAICNHKNEGLLRVNIEVLE